MTTQFSDDDSVGSIADQLKGMVAYGATLSKISSMPGLLRLTGMPESCSPQAKAVEALGLIRAALGRLEGTYGIHRRPESFTADQVRQALVWLLVLNRRAGGLSAGNRRHKALEALGTRGLTVDTFRRPGMYEYSLMLILARELLEGRAVAMAA
ncbi:hypothetical protein [Frankia sp. AgW1.1]|uniref:hypothetical protein n=1 Tax=Frankia sp. AgW1.1 TaxID=1836971 RepID=UPI001931E16A|nr:hypothetical protein [Frankia sp. AgW1.1]